VQELFDKALDCLRAEDLGGAGELLERVLAAGSAHALAHYHLGNVRRDQGDHVAAERHFIRAVELAPAHAEAHNNLGVLQEVSGRSEEAVASYRRAVQAKATLTQAYLNLGRLLMQLGRRGEAAECYRDAIASSDQPPIFVHLLAALDGRSTAAAPADYVRATFDGFARDFDERLVGHFDYHVPEVIARSIRRIRPFGPRSAEVLDLGCGTGLSGAALADVCKRLVGVDVSGNMLQEARARGCYQELAEAEILEWMRAAAPAMFDLVIAADVLVYFGDLGPIFGQARRLLRPGGLFAFSIEVCRDADWRLQDSGRYAQSAAYIERLARQHGFTVALRADQPIRKPIVGLLYILQRPAGGLSGLKRLPLLLFQAVGGGRRRA
jgi:predicted TPR repeat methyltransferase